MLEGGKFDPKGMFYIVQASAYAYFSFGHFGHELFGDLEEGMPLNVVLFPHLKWEVNPQS